MISITSDETLRHLLKRAIRPGDGSRLVAWRALVDGVREGGQDALDAAAGAARLDSRDRALVYEMAQGVWRNRRLFDAAFRQLPGFRFGEVDPSMLELLRVGAYQHFFLDRVPVHALVNETVEAARTVAGARPAGFVNAFLHCLTERFAGRGDELAALREGLPDETRYSFPGWGVRLLARALGRERVSVALEALNRPLPIYARARGGGEALVRALGEAGIESVARPDLAPACVEIAAGVAAILESAPFVRGDFIMQDASAQLTAELAGVRPGMAVVDFCAAPGGKTTFLADRMECTGTLIACDVSRGRLFRVAENLTRLGLGAFVDIRHLREDGLRRGEEEGNGGAVGGDADVDFLLARLHGGEGADRVLVDAPCSGLGTLRRHPEIRWRLRHADLQRLAGMQLRILERGARLVRRGGWLIYSTCSLAPEENEEVVEAFLDRSGGRFRRVRGRGDGEWSEALKNRINEDGFFHTWPDRDEADSAGAVRLERVGV